MTGAIRISIAIVVLIWIYAFMMAKDEKALAIEARQTAISKALSKLDYVEAANIRECMAKFATTENVSAIINGQVLECRTKRGYLMGSI